MRVYSQLVLLILPLAAGIVLGQDLPKPLTPQLTSIVAKACRVVPPEGSKLLPMATPVIIPSVAVVDKQTTKAIDFVMGIPRLVSGEIIASDPRPISSGVLQYFDDLSSFELGFRRLNSDETSRLAKAYAVLYDDPDTREQPTKKYGGYRDWMAKRRALLIAIENEANTPRKLSLNQELNLLDQDYKLIGDKEQLEAAIEIVRKYSTEAPLFADQLKTYRQSTSTAADAIARARLFGKIASPAAWVRIASDAGTAGLSGPIEVILQLDAGQSMKFRVPIRWLSLQAVVCPVDQPLVNADVFGNRAWRRRDQKVLSDGKWDNPDAKPLPYFMTSILVIRDLEIEFDRQAPDFAQLSAQFDRATSASIGGIVVPFTGPGSGFVLPGRLYSPRPIVVAGVVTVPAPVPNSLPDLDWKQP